MSCSPTKLTNTWMDETARGRSVRDVLVIGISDEQAVRRSFEDKFVKRFNDSGVEAVAGWSELPTDKPLDKADIDAAIQRLDIDTLIITHLLGVDQKEVYNPPRTYRVPTHSHLGYYGYYGIVYDYVHQPGYYTTNTKVLLETNLYDANTEKLIWSARSETLNPSSDRQMIDSVINSLIDDLTKNGLIQ